MNKISYYLFMIVASICIIASLYLYNHKDELGDSKNENRVVDTVKKIEKELINPDSILYIKYNDVELKSEPSAEASLKAYLKINSIFYIKSRSEQIIQTPIKGRSKNIEDYWYEITDLKGLTGWVFGYYTSKALQIRKFK
jgi:hypothetical protein